MVRRFIVLAIVLTLVACGSQQEKTLPVLGPFDIRDTIINGSLAMDTLYPGIPRFAFVNQYGETIDNSSVEGKIYVADFFFTSCPTICPKMSQQMLRLHTEFESDPDIMLLSHSIDPRHDTPERLLKYAQKLGVGETDKWMFLNGDQDEVYALAKSYMVSAMEDSLAPGGFAHSGAFLLVDGEQNIRGIYDGTQAKEVDELMEDIKLLKNR